MTKVMAVNAGSSSLKFQLFNMPSEEVITSGIVERIGLEEGIFTIKYNGQKKTVNCPIPDHQVAVDMLLKALIEEGIVAELSEINAVGHRIVHGGEYFNDSAVVNEDVGVICTASHKFGKGKNYGIKGAVIWAPSGKIWRDSVTDQSRLILFLSETFLFYNYSLRSCLLGKVSKTSHGF